MFFFFNGILVFVKVFVFWIGVLVYRIILGEKIWDDLRCFII